MPELQGTEVFQEAGSDSAAAFADAGAEPQRRPETSSGQKTPVQSSSQRSLQRAPASQLCAARAQILLPGQQPTSVPGKGRCTALCK